jgi:hypothetical protein
MWTTIFSPKADVGASNSRRCSATVHQMSMIGVKSEV